MKYYIFLACLLLQSIAHAQVKIGDATPPVQGALLELSQGETTTKGLMLPRLCLTDLSSMKDIIPDAVDRPDPLSHIGLMVYNVVDGSEVCMRIPPGVYSWEGTAWIRMGNPYKQNSKLDILDRTSTIISFHKDQEGQDFVAGTFGSAGTWMLHNLAVTQYADGSPIAPYAPNTPSDIGYYSFPNLKKEKNFLLENGFLYNWKAIVKNEPINSIKHQGICPTGWHLPTNAEWDKLAKEVYENNIYSYTNNSGSPLWQTNWESHIGYYASNIVEASATISQVPAITKIGLGTLMKDVCMLDYTYTTQPMGLSKKIQDKGFNLELNGFVTDGLSYNYGTLGYFWSVSSTTTTPSNIENKYAFSRYVSAYTSGFGRNESNKTDLLSVRCVKD